MKKLLLSAFALIAFAAYTSAQNPEKNIQDKKKVEHHSKAKTEGAKAGHKDWSDKKMHKKAGKKGSDTTGAK